ncbi:MAG: acyltransferase [Lachnospiraceae bacterium]|nr:acyltransferase [Lachnospiraceae bacterium]
MKELAVRAAFTLPRILWWKCRYRGRLSLPWVQALGKHGELHMDKKGRLSLGKETVSRFGLFLRVEGGELSIGDKCFFNTQVSITCMEKISIGDRCQIANHVVIVDHDHDYQAGWGHYQTAPVTIGSDVWIGANVVILKGSIIGDGAVIAAGTVVRGHVKPCHLYLGIHRPQRPLETGEKVGQL